MTVPERSKDPVRASPQGTVANSPQSNRVLPAQGTQLLTPLGVAIPQPKVPVPLQHLQLWSGYTSRVPLPCGPSSPPLPLPCSSSKLSCASSSCKSGAVVALPGPTLFSHLLMLCVWKQEVACSWHPPVSLLLWGWQGRGGASCDPLQSANPGCRGTLCWPQGSSLPALSLLTGRDPLSLLTALPAAFLLPTQELAVFGEAADYALWPIAGGDS